MRVRVTEAPVSCSKWLIMRLGPGVGQQPAEAEPEGDLVAHNGQGLVEGGKDTLGVGEELGAGGRQLDVPGGAVEETDVQVALQLRDRTAQSRLRDQQFLGCPGEGPVSCHRREGPQVTEFDVHAHRAFFSDPCLPCIAAA